jgi:FkbM family methyltransferase
MARSFKRLIRRCLSLLGKDLVNRPAPLCRRRDAVLPVTLADVVARRVLECPDFFFVQVGAFDGVTFDPIHPLVRRYRLRGLVLEPQADAFGRLRANYADQPGVFAVHAALGPTNGPAQLHRVRPGAVGPPILHQLASFRREILLKHRATVPHLADLVETETVPCLSVETLLRTYAIGHVHLLQIDTEGLDAQVIQWWDLAKRRPDIIHFEHKHLSRSEWELCLQRLIDHGYRIAPDTWDTLAVQPLPVPVESGGT